MHGSMGVCNYRLAPKSVRHRFRFASVAIAGTLKHRIVNLSYGILRPGHRWRPGLWQEEFCFDQGIIHRISTSFQTKCGATEHQAECPLSKPLAVTVREYGRREPYQLCVAVKRHCSGSILP